MPWYNTWLWFCLKKKYCMHNGRQTHTMPPVVKDSAVVFHVRQLNYSRNRDRIQHTNVGLSGTASRIIGIKDSWLWQDNVCSNYHNVIMLWLKARWKMQSVSAFSSHGILHSLFTCTGHTVPGNAPSLPATAPAGGGGKAFMGSRSNIINSNNNLTSSSSSSSIGRVSQCLLVNISYQCCQSDSSILL